MSPYRRLMLFFTTRRDGQYAQSCCLVVISALRERGGNVQVVGEMSGRRGANGAGQLEM